MLLNDLTHNILKFCLRSEIYLKKNYEETVAVVWGKASA